LDNGPEREFCRDADRGVALPEVLITADDQEENQ